MKKAPLILFAAVFVISDKITTLECLKRGFVELNCLACSPLFPVYQFILLTAIVTAFAKLCDMLAASLPLVGKRLPLLALEILLLYPIANNVLNILRAL
ncbi:MAG: hypothetical protein QXV85_10575 [Candidatus Bathyarchaeia archaeon]